MSIVGVVKAPFSDNTPMTNGLFRDYLEHRLQILYQEVSDCEMQLGRLFEGKPLSSGLRKAYKDGRVMPPANGEGK